MKGKNIMRIISSEIKNYHGLVDAHTGISLATLDTIY
jgi:hypothetical protein